MGPIRSNLTLHADFILTIIIGCESLRHNSDFVDDYGDIILPIDYISYLGFMLINNVRKPMFDPTGGPTYFLYYYQASKSDIEYVINKEENFSKVLKKYACIKNECVVFKHDLGNIAEILSELGYSGINQQFLKQCNNITESYFSVENKFYNSFDEKEEKRKELIRSNKYTPFPISGVFK